MPSRLSIPCGCCAMIHEIARAFGWVKEVVGLASAANGTNNKAEEASTDGIVVV